MSVGDIYYSPKAELGSGLLAKEIEGDDHESTDNHTGSAARHSAEQIDLTQQNAAQGTTPKTRR